MDQARIIYVTGMKPKPDPVVHRVELVRVLAAALGRLSPGAADWLTARPERFTLVSWTSLLYDVERDIGLDRPGIARILEQPEPAAADRRAADAPGLALRRAWHLIGDSFPALSRALVPAALQQTLADVRRYLDNVDGIADRIRALLGQALDEAYAADAAVLLVGHSLGSVIAYDTLWQRSRADGDPRAVSLFMTLGSPLATRFIRKELKGSRLKGPERYPANIGDWVNVAARGELVSLHRRLRPFFGDMEKFGLVRSIEDVSIYNHYRGDRGFNPHKSYGYLNHAAVAGRICRWLES